MKANYNNKPEKKTEVALTNLYDMNKQLMEKENPMTDEQLNTTRLQLKEWIIKNDTKYFMLLCHEQRDYTIFNLEANIGICNTLDDKFTMVAADVLECMINRGTLLAAEPQEAGGWELWIKNEDGCFAYYFFPYSDAVIEY